MRLSREFAGCVNVRGEFLAQKRWIIVSNRLPVSLDPTENHLVQSSGGLVTAIKGIRNQIQKVWVGCAPDGVSESTWPKLARKWKGEESLEPLFVPPRDYDLYYNGLCNDHIWPILHYETGRSDYNVEFWEAYERINHKFAEKILKVAKADDVIWVHDFHLFLLPALLKAKNPRLKVGFFLHVPFPSSEIFRQMPNRVEFLKGLIAADLVGFHDYSYLRHFSSSVLRVLGIDSSFFQIKHRNHLTRLGVFPVSIDTPELIQKSKSEEVKLWCRKISSSLFSFLGVDRLDYTKGIELKLAAYANFLKNYPEMRGKVRLTQLAIPTRQGVPHYQELKEDVERMVGEINGKYSTSTWTPIRYLYSTVSQEELLALYRCADALIVSSKRDGMNLVCLEYVASQTSHSPGVVMLSEFTGALSLLGHTIAMNPWDTEDSAHKMKQAIDMPKDERQSRWGPMVNFLRNYTSTDWAESFMNELLKTKDKKPWKAEEIDCRKSSARALVKRLGVRDPSDLVLLVDYDGTLVSITPSPELAILPEKAKELLLKISKLGVNLVVVSGRNRKFLSSQFDKVPFGLAGEHGAIVYHPDRDKWISPTRKKRSTWYETGTKIMEDYASRVQNSFVERKAFSLVWHYRKSATEYASYMALKLQEELELGLANAPVSILNGKKIIEVRALEANKGLFVSNLIGNLSEDKKVLALGDDITDEDMFEAVKGAGLSIKVGRAETSADYALSDQSEVLDLLENLHDVLAT